MSEPLEIPFSEFDEYIRQGEPDQREKAGIWSVAIGLQQVDGLHVSKFLLQTALRNIKGEITMDEAQEIIRKHYENKQPQLAEKTSVESTKTSVESTPQSITEGISKSQFDTLDISLEEKMILSAIASDPNLKQQQMTELIHKSIATVKRITISLQEKGLLRRENGKRNGKWTILYDEDIRK